MFLNLLGNFFATREANFGSETMFPGVGKQGNMNRKQNVSETMFPRGHILRDWLYRGTNSPS